jgi:hypothetical protein
MGAKIFPIKLDAVTKGRLRRVSSILGMSMAKIIKLSLENENISLGYYEKLAKHYDNRKELNGR